MSSVDPEREARDAALMQAQLVRWFLLVVGLAIVVLGAVRYIRYQMLPRADMPAAEQVSKVWITLDGVQISEVTPADWPHVSAPLVFAHKINEPSDPKSPYEFHLKTADKEYKIQFYNNDYGDFTLSEKSAGGGLIGQAYRPLETEHAKMLFNETSKLKPAPPPPEEE